MNLIKSERTCPEWCTRSHSESEALENDYYHSKPFGAYEDGTLGVIEVGVSELDGEFINPEIVIDYIEMNNAQDLRDLARDCLEAAKWIEETPLLIPAPVLV